MRKNEIAILWTKEDATVADEMFVLLGWAWDVDRAAELAARHPIRRVDIRPLTWALPVIKINSDHSENVDLAHPLLVVPLPTCDSWLVIDGWHRVYHALAIGVSELPAILL